MVAVYALLAIQALRAEERGVRTDPVLATAVSRTGWLTSCVTVTALGSLWLLVLAGLGNGIGAATSTGDWDLFGPALLGQVIQTPTIWALLGLAIALYGIAPRLISLTWVILVYGGMVAKFGVIMTIDDTV